MSHVRVNAKVLSDATGAMAELPVILLADGGQISALGPLVDYLLANSQARSLSWMRKVCQAVGLLLDYMEVNQSNFERPHALFDTFAQRVYSGTIGEDGRDPSGLYWLPRRSETARQLLSVLSDFSDEMHRHRGTEPLNPWREATSYEQRLGWAAFVNKSERSFLGHLDSRAEATEAAKTARSTRLRRTPVGDRAQTKAFPENRLEDLLFTGFMVPGMQQCPDIVARYDWRGICLTLLLNGGGLRDCEPFHLWVHDVATDPQDPSVALVRVFHPIDGAAPKDFRGPNGRHMANREAYLAARYPGYGPRNRATGNYHAGWKSPKLSDASQKYLHVHWFPRGMGRLFLQAWKLYMYQRLHARIGADKHPFLFVSFRGAQRGEPYTIDAFRDAHARAVRRIGLVPAKMGGTTEHGHRHAYGQRISSVDPGERVIQSGLHHRSAESQAVYTEPSIERVTRVLTDATDSLATGGGLPMNFDLDAVLHAEREEQKCYAQQNAK